MLIDKFGASPEFIKAFESLFVLKLNVALKIMYLICPPETVISFRERVIAYKEQGGDHALEADIHRQLSDESLYDAYWSKASRPREVEN